MNKITVSPDGDLSRMYSCNFKLCEYPGQVFTRLNVETLVGLAPRMGLPAALLVSLLLNLEGVESVRVLGNYFYLRAQKRGFFKDIDKWSSFDETVARLVETAYEKRPLWREVDQTKVSADTQEMPGLFREVN